MISMVLTKEQHAIFTKAWRSKIGYTSSRSILRTDNVTREQVIKAARDIYKDYPAILKALGL